jgi:hypothetical protein
MAAYWASLNSNGESNEGSPLILENEAHGQAGGFPLAGARRGTENLQAPNEGHAAYGNSHRAQGFRRFTDISGLETIFPY